MLVWQEIRHQASCRLSQQAPTEMQGVLDPGMPGELVAGGAAVVDGQVAGYYGDVAGSGAGSLDRSERLLVAELLRDGGYGDRAGPCLDAVSARGLTRCRVGCPDTNGTRPGRA
jgi:hypothetical protein